MGYRNAGVLIVSYRKQQCCGCATIYKVSDDGQIIWRRDHFKDASPAEMSEIGSDNINASGKLAMLACDQSEVDGHVYGGGYQSRALVSDSSLTQPEMATLRCYSEGGSLLWSYASDPTGAIGGLGGAYRFAPQHVLGLRCLPNGMVVLHEGPGLADTDEATALNPDGSVAWQHTLVDLIPIIFLRAWRLVGVADDFSSWHAWGASLTPHVIHLDHNGNVTLNFFIGTLADQACVDAAGGTYIARNTYALGVPTAVHTVYKVDQTYAVVWQSFLPAGPVTSIRTDGSIVIASLAKTSVLAPLYRIYDAATGVLIDEIVLAADYGPVRYYSEDYGVGLTWSQAANTDRWAAVGMIREALTMDADKRWQSVVLPGPEPAIQTAKLYDATIASDGTSIWCGGRICGTFLVPEG